MKPLKKNDCKVSPPPIHNITIQGDLLYMNGKEAGKIIKRKGKQLTIERISTNKYLNGKIQTLTIL